MNGYTGAMMATNAQIVLFGNCAAQLFMVITNAEIVVYLCGRSMVNGD